ncbi:hypothetical protein ABZ568_25985 [Streptomyces olindensis]|uniref:Uncharacterized protein n=1 Tax=Streptomyces olindensis TaxID=358823 RepID=A0ABV2Y0L3_9ACTN
MTLLPITAPASLVDVHRLEPEAGGWGFTVEHAVATAAGDTHVLTGLRRYRGQGAGSADPEEQDFGYQLTRMMVPSAATARRVQQRWRERPCPI